MRFEARAPRFSRISKSKGLRHPAHLVVVLDYAGSSQAEEHEAQGQSIEADQTSRLDILNKSVSFILVPPLRVVANRSVGPAHGCAVVISRMMKKITDTAAERAALKSRKDRLQIHWTSTLVAVPGRRLSSVNRLEDFHAGDKCGDEQEQCGRCQHGQGNEAEALHAVCAVISQLRNSPGNSLHGERDHHGIAHYRHVVRIRIPIRAVSACQQFGPLMPKRKGRS